jgi:DinB family protein
VAEDKDWTCVLERPCRECGFDSSGVDPVELPGLFIANALDWQATLAGLHRTGRTTAPRGSRGESGVVARGAACDTTSSTVSGAVGGAMVGEWVTRRPTPGVWSPLEYACHVRDVHRLFQDRLQLILVAENPIFPDWDGDQAAEDGVYNQQPSAVVARDLVHAARGTAARYASIEVDQWQRTGQRSDGSPFTVATLGTYQLHDAVHHLHDVRCDRGYV